jgi:hypothetical protein
MSVTVDFAPLAAEELGLATVGQVLTHLQKGNRLVVRVLVDGQEPDLRKLCDLKKSVLKDHTVFIETTDPLEMAREIFREIDIQLGEADQLKTEAADFLQKNQNVRAMEKLSRFFSTWQNARQSVVSLAQLLKVNLDEIMISGQTFGGLIGELAERLREIKSALENRDFVMLSDLLLYETSQTTSQWRDALTAMRASVV